MEVGETDLRRFLSLFLFLFVKFLRSYTIRKHFTKFFLFFLSFFPHLAHSFVSYYGSQMTVTASHRQSTKKTPIVVLQAQPISEYQHIFVSLFFLSRGQFRDCRFCVVLFLPLQLGLHLFTIKFCSYNSCRAATRVLRMDLVRSRDVHGHLSLTRVRGCPDLSAFRCAQVNSHSCNNVHIQAHARPLLRPHFFRLRGGAGNNLNADIDDEDRSWILVCVTLEKREQVHPSIPPVAMASAEASTWNTALANSILITSVPVHPQSSDNHAAKSRNVVRPHSRQDLSWNIARVSVPSPMATAQRRWRGHARWKSLGARRFEAVLHRRRL